MRESMMRNQSSTTFGLTAAGLLLGLVGACGSQGAKTSTDAGPTGLGGSPAGDAAPDTATTDALTDTPPADASADVASGSDAVDNRQTNPDAGPSASDLQGAWYATVIPRFDGGTTRQQRIRFADGTYYLVYQTATLYCGEVGSFQITDSGVAFTPDHVEGLTTNCPPAVARVEPVHWTGDAVTFDTAAGATTYRRTRAVPKLFVTFESHDGNIAGDASLPGIFAIDKADAICARSIARPDGATYRALLADGNRRTAAPANDWVLAPDTTYFEPDGVLNVFTTGADAASLQSHHGIVADEPPGNGLAGSYAWIWMPALVNATARTTTCRGWTSNSNNDSAALADITSTYRLGGACGTPYPIVCVASPLPATGDRDGGATDAGAANDPVLQGNWSVPPAVVDGGVVPIRRRIRFDAAAYDLVIESSTGYCGEIGSFRSSGSSVAFAPQRIIGTGQCTIGVDRVETLDVATNDITLSIGGASQRYTRAADVLKLFATLEVHSADFASDATLTGASAIEKADAFCNRSAARPDAHTYKAVLADGTHRSPSIDWPLQPTTNYYESRGIVDLFKTDNSGLILGSMAVDTVVRGQSVYLWTGLTYNAATHLDTVSTDTCGGWSSTTASTLGAAADGMSPYIFDSSSSYCADTQNGLICAGQP